MAHLAAPLRAAAPKPNTGTWLVAGGLGLAAIGAFVLYKRRQAQLQGGRPQLGRLQTKIAAPAPVVGTTVDKGMTTTHRRSAHMPIDQRVRSIQDMVWESVKLPSMRKLALAITNKCPERDELCEAKAIYAAVRNRVRYTGDIAPVKLGNGGPVEPVDLYQRADRTWEFAGGDCDDQNILIATLLSLVGTEARLRVTKETKADDWGHIYPVGGLPKGRPTKWYALDTTLPGRTNFGKEVPFADNIDYPV